MQKSIPLRENTCRTTKDCLRNKWCFFISLVIILLATPFLSFAQLLTKKEKEKTAPGFAERFEQTAKGNKIVVTVQVKSFAAWKQCAGADTSFQLLHLFEPTQTLVIKADKNFIKKIVQCDAVVFADDVKQPKEELLLGFVDYALNNISLLQSQYPQYNGNSLSVSVKENKFDTTDIDFKGRIITSTNASSTVSSHASSMATIIAGGGNTWNYTKGAAWSSKISSASFSNLLPEPLTYYQGSNITLQNHSYGTLVEHFYGAEAAGYDASVNAIPSLVHIFSVGNSGTLAPAAGRYSGIAATANITGNFKQAKNIITVGHLDSFYNVLAPSSRGPAFDGRIKPELVAFGEDGSSGAAALVSGIATVLQDAYKQLNGNLPAASFIKSVLLNSADDVGAAGIDFASGYGNANGYKALQTVLQNRFFNGSVNNTSSQNFSITIPANIKQLKLTLAWTDIASQPNTAKALINDLDLELKNNATSQTWLPWVLSSFPNKDSLLLLPVRKKDTLNNTEQISIDNPAAGTYTITVKGASIPAGTQNFSVAWQSDTLNTFKWTYPSRNDHLLPPDSNVIRWQNTFSGTGELQISAGNGSAWQLIDNNVNLAKGFYKYAPPSIYQTALLRMKIGSTFFVSDTFTISKRLLTSVGFNCTDSFMINWQKIPGVSNYQLYRMGNQYLEPFAVAADTFLVLNKAGNPVLEYAVAPVVNNKPLVRSYTFNYTLQGSGCFISTFVGDISPNNQINLQLNISTIVRIKSIVFEKRGVNGWSSIYSTNTINSLQYLFTDVTTKPGSNIYRAFVELIDGRKIYSDELVIYFRGPSLVKLYPNPVQRNTTITVLAKPEDELTIQLFNANGMMVLQQLLNDVPENISISNLQAGVYYYRIVQKDKKVESGKLIIY
ncbi:MAG: S8 family peptidase [Chitinophagaceae bacterium]|nr:S8 family peptidase [Chitinophagaceae bacterium]